MPEETLKMRIKFTKDYGGTKKAGEIYELIERKAKEIIANGFAILAPVEKPKAKKVEKADAPPKAENADAPQASKSGFDTPKKKDNGDALPSKTSGR